MEPRPYIAFAPLQGYTDCTYRQAHHRHAGGADEYYTPFVRIESGAPRKKEMKDISPEANQGVPTVPQIIAGSREEFATLCDALQQQGWNRIDFNMGCPFPMQVKAGRGSGLLPRPEAFKEIAEEMALRKEVTFSVKMRLGQESKEEYLPLLPTLNRLPLAHITMHPRTGKEQYKSKPDLTSFEQFCQRAAHPIVYNGDITDTESITRLQSTMPTLKGFMIGRGLLSRPWMLCNRAPTEVVLDMHRDIYTHATEHLCGDSQILTRLHAFWEYLAPSIDRKIYKAIMKSGSLRNYNIAVGQLTRKEIV